MLLTLAVVATLAAPGSAQTAQDHIAQGDEAYSRLAPREAVAHYEAGLLLDSASYEALWKAARSLVDIGKQMDDRQKEARDSAYVVAERHARRAVEVNPGGADGHFMVAYAVGQMALTKGPKERVKFAKIVREQSLRAIELDSLHDGAYHVIGRWHAEVMRLPGITKFFAKTFLGAGIFSEASWDNAVRYLSRAVELNPTNVYHHLDLAEVYLDVEQPDQARPHLQQVLALPVTDVMDPTYQEQAQALLRKLESKS